MTCDGCKQTFATTLLLRLHQCKPLDNRVKWLRNGTFRKVDTR